MYRVLIVDDEEPVLDSYAFLLDGYKGEFSLAGKARSGYEAMQLMHEVNPDIVFMDINIPGMDGIEVIESVHQKFPGTVFILSTAYERFDLAQRAIPLGVFSYLVKPVSKKTFLSTLDAVEDHLEKRKPAVPAGAESLAERQFLKETIWRPIPSQDWERYRTLFGFHSDKGIVCLVESEDEHPRWCQDIAVKLSYKYRCLFALHANRGLYFIPEDVDRDSLLAYLGTIVDSVIPEKTLRAYAVGRVHHGTELRLSCDEALAGLQEKRASTDIQNRERFRIIQIRRRLGLSSLEEVRALFASLWQEVFFASDFTLAKAKMVSLFTLLIDDATGCYSGRTEAAPPFIPAEEIMPLADEAAWEEWSFQAFEKVHDLFALRRTGNYPGPLVRAIEYINERYTEPLQLSSAADAAKVSSAYLSRLFSEHLHTSFVDYLTELRIDQAERLISQASMSIKEVAFAVGIQDPNYFSKIFRKATGLPPTLYAAQKRGAPTYSERKDNP
jgi:two-component system, response regulator YesN